MDRLAIISDIHGNLPALHAVLADVDRRGANRLYCLGDLAGKGPDGDRALDLCRERCDGIVRGNWDEGLATYDDGDHVFRWHQARLGPGRLAYLAALSNTIDLLVSGRRLRLLHASPRGVFHRVPQTAPVETLLTMFDDTEFTGPGFATGLVGYGDIHSAYLRTFRDKLLFNAGSVGNPLDLPLASYALLEGEVDRLDPAPWSITLIRVPYDINRAIQDAVDAAMPDLAPYAAELRTARYRHAKPDPPANPAP